MVVEMAVAVVLVAEQQGRRAPQVPQDPQDPRDLPAASDQRDIRGLRVLAGLALMGLLVHRDLQVPRARPVRRALRV